MSLIITSLLWFSAISCGLIAGVCFAFSTFIMSALGRIDHVAGISAMNAINVDIVQSLFIVLMLGTTVASAALAGIAIFRWSEPGAVPMFIGGALFFTGMFVSTMIFNVPLNDALAAVDPASTEGAALWARYVSDWTFWNHVRTIASTASFALFILSITTR